MADGQPDDLSPHIPDQRSALAEIIEEQTRELPPVVLTVRDNMVDATPVMNRMMQVMTSVLFHQGPLPPPDLLRGYEMEIPGAGFRILAMAEREQQHRHDMERFEARIEARRGDRGQMYGLVIAVVFMAAAVWVAVAGHEIAATTIGTLDIGAVVALFVLGGHLTGAAGRRAPDDKEESDAE